MTTDVVGGGLGYLLVQAAQAWRAGVAARLADLAVTPSQFFVLVTLLRRHDRAGLPITQRDVAERTRMDANTTSQLVRGLERRGLVSRSPHPADTRAVVVELTDAGAELTRECAIRVRAVSRGFFDTTDRGALHEALTTLLEKAGPR